MCPSSPPPSSHQFAIGFLFVHIQDFMRSIPNQTISVAKEDIRDFSTRIEIRVSIEKKEKDKEKRRRIREQKRKERDRRRETNSRLFKEKG